jgi:hypothetical protein
MFTTLHDHGLPGRDGRRHNFGVLKLVIRLRRKFKRRLKEIEHKCCREDLVVEEDYY